MVAGDRAQLCCKGAGGTGLYGDAGLRVFVQGDEDGCAAQVFYLEGQPGPVVRGKTAALNLGLHGGAGGAVTKLRGLKRGCVRRRGWGTGGDKQGREGRRPGKNENNVSYKSSFLWRGENAAIFLFPQGGKNGQNLRKKEGRFFKFVETGEVDAPVFTRVENPGIMGKNTGGMGKNGSDTACTVKHPLRTLVWRSASLCSMGGGGTPFWQKKLFRKLFWRRFPK